MYQTAILCVRRNWSASIFLILGSGEKKGGGVANYPAPPNEIGGQIIGTTTKGYNEQNG